MKPPRLNKKFNWAGENWNARRRRLRRVSKKLFVYLSCLNIQIRIYIQFTSNGLGLPIKLVRLTGSLLDHLIAIKISLAFG